MAPGSRLKAKITIRNLLGNISVIVFLFAGIWPGHGLAQARQGEQSAAAKSPAFTKATPESQGLSTKSLEHLAAEVKGFVRQDKIVGAELLVVKNRRVVLHEAHGMKDKERGAAMQPDSIFCIRSMTKPVVGIAIQMLIDEGKLSADDRIAKYLPSFDNDKSREITVKHLLTHTSGLPLSSSLRVSYAKFKNLREVADITGQHGPDFQPGNKFQYSDDGTDTLGALVAQIVGGPVEQFIQKRILDPLHMKDTVCLVNKTDSRINRFVSAYFGAAGMWTKFWEPGKDPIFSFFLGSQGMYSTPADYARFLAFLMDGGKVDGKQLISKEALARIMTPAVDMAYPSGFEGLRAHYGQQMMLYLDQGSKVKAFGHGGSDGTHAYAWPEKDLMVLYFTQSRGNTTFLEFEAALHRSLLDPDGKKDVAAKKFDPELVAPYLGMYWSELGKRVMTIVLRNEQLAIELPWEATYELSDTGKPNRWAFKLDPAIVIEFERKESAQATGFTIEQRGQKFYQSRLQRDEGLPTVEELMKLRQKTLKSDRLAAMGVIRLTGTMERSTPAAKGTFTQLIKGVSSYRSEVTIEQDSEQVAVDGRSVWTASSKQAAKEASGILADQTRLDHPAAVIADWRDLFKEVEILKKISENWKTLYVVRCVPHEAPTRIFYVDAADGKLLVAEHIEMVPGLGYVGKRVMYDDYRDVSGVQYPFRQTHSYASPLLGRYTQIYENVQTGFQAPDDAFKLKATQ